MQHTPLLRLLRRMHGHRSLRRSAATNTSAGDSCAPTPFRSRARLLCTSRVSWCAAAAPATSSSPAPSASEFAAIAPQLLLRQALQQYTELDGTRIGAELHSGENHVLISREKFLQFCAQSHVYEPDVALADLEAAGVVVVLDGGRLVHLRPVLYLETLELLSGTETTAESNENSRTDKCNSNGEDARSEKGEGAPMTSAASAIGAFMMEEAEHRIAQLCQREQAMTEQLQPAIARAAKWRRSVWGGALLFAGTQLAVISRLTYFDLDWDIMEPVSYCITVGTALVFYVYYLVYNEEHTYEAFDQRFLPKKVRQYAPKDFDWAAYERTCAQLVEERAMLERLRRWAQRH